MAGFPGIPKKPPPVCGNCLTVSQPAAPDAKPQQFPSKVFRAEQGQTRMDYGDTSVINDPAKQQSIVLDHLKKEAKIIPMPPPLPAPGLPGAPPPRPMEVGAPPGSDMKVEDLGKAFIDGQEVEGRKYTFTPPKPPPMPEMPKPPEPPKPPDLPKPPAVPKPPVAGMPRVPGAPPIPEPPKPPGAPEPPKMPEMPPPPDVGPVVTEVWTSTDLKMPVLTKTQSKFGQQMCRCKYAAGEPPKDLFQIPPDYKMVTAPPV